MADSRISGLARVLVHYSLEIKPGERLRIITNPAAEPLIREVYREALLAGAHPLTRTTFDFEEELLYRYGSPEQLQYVSADDREDVEGADAILYIRATTNTRRLSQADAEKIALRRSARRPLNSRFDERSALGEMRWCLTVFPTSAAAQDAEMALDEYEDFVFGAGKLCADDPVAAWRETATRQEQLAAKLNTRRVFRIVAPGTDLTYDTGGRSWVSCAGKLNFPDGEVFTSPDEHKTEGYIHYTFPAVYSGREVTDVRLEFAGGQVVKATASKGEELLHSLIDMDEGARRLGEAAFGTNYEIERFSRNTLFDEKIGGTIHLALGNALTEARGTNQSALHWDMVCDLRQGGMVYADGELIYKDGVFLI